MKKISLQNFGLMLFKITIYGNGKKFTISWKNKWNPVPIVFIWQAQFLLPVYILAVTQTGILYTKAHIIYLESEPLRHVVGSLYSPTLGLTESHENNEFFETRTKFPLEFCDKITLKDKLVLQVDHIF